MGKQFEAELKQLNDDLLRMGSAVEETISTAMKAFIDRDVELAQKVIASDDMVDELENHIEDLCLKLLALHQPAAIDLRFIIMAIKINSDLERIADLAVNICDRTVEQAGQPHLKPLIDIPRMAEKSREMLRRSLDAFVQRDAEAAKQIAAEDDEIDALYDQVYRELLLIMIQNPRTITQSTYLLWAAHNLERIADRVTNICERVVFMATGRMEEINVSKY